MKKDIKYRVLEKDDISKIVDMVEKPEVSRYLFFKNFPRKEKENYFLSLLGTDSVYIVEINGEFAGNCGFTFENGVYNIGYQLDNKFWGQGIGKEIGKFILKKVINLGAKNIVADCIEGNIASQKIIEGLGFEYFEKIENKYNINGIWHNNLYFKLNIPFESRRLIFRKITKNDFKSLCKILKDPEIMHAWEHGFSDDEVREWIDKNLKRYEEDGFSYFAGIERENLNFVGVIGPLVDEVDGERVTELAYILDKEYWGRGYAIEGGEAALKYTFENLNIDRVVAQIRLDNISSKKVAEKLGMTIQGEFIKSYRGKNTPHLIYVKIK